jgi:hypothetical protein
MRKLLLLSALAFAGTVGPSLAQVAPPVVAPVVNSEVSRGTSSGISDSVNASKKAEQDKAKDQTKANDQQPPKPDKAEPAPAAPQY